jgi:hypothetical protein
VTGVPPKGSSHERVKNKERYSSAPLLSPLAAARFGSVGCFSVTRRSLAQVLRRRTLCRGLAAATAAIGSRQDPQVAQDTSAFLKKQAQLLEACAAYYLPIGSRVLRHVCANRSILLARKLDLMAK